MLLYGLKETKESTLGTRSNTVSTILHFITVYRLRRFVWNALFNSHETGDNISSAIQGYIVDWDAQKAVWDGVFSPEVLGVSLGHSEFHSTLKAASDQPRRVFTSDHRALL